MNSRTALSHTLGFDSGELVSYQYQPGVFSRAIYAVDDNYYCVGKNPPKSLKHLDGLVWNKFSDQFWAEKANTTIWIASRK